MVTTRLLLVSALFVSAPFAAFAASEATVGVKIAELRIKPDDAAFSRLKIPGGREVDVLGKSDDGRWIKVRTQIERGEDIIKLEGWLEASQLKGADPSSLSVASGGQTSSGSSSSSSSDGFGESSSSSDAWTAPSEPAASSNTEAWDAAPASTPSEPAADSSSDMGSWDLGDTNSSSSSSDTSSDPAPAEGGDTWDSGSGDSGSSSESTDGW